MVLNLLRRWGFVFSITALICNCTSPSPLKIASHIWPGYEFIFHAQREGWLKPADIQLLETANASESLQALVDARVDGATLTLDEVLRAREQGIALTVVLLIDISAGADALLVNSNIKTLQELKGKRIGVETSALGGLMLQRILQTAHLSPADVSVIPITMDAHVQAWHAGTLDAIITYEPVVQQIEAEAEGGVRLFDSRQLPNTIFDVLAVRSERVQSHAQQLKTLVAEHFHALHAWRSNPIDTAYRFVRHLALPAESIPLLYRGLELPDENYNRQMLSAPAHKLMQLANEIQTLMVWHQPLDGLFQAEYISVIEP